MTQMVLSKVQGRRGAVTRAMLAVAGCLAAAAMARGDALTSMPTTMPASLPTTAPANAPSVAVIIEKSTEAAGGKERLASIKSIEVSGTMTMPQQNVSGKFTLIKKPDRAVMSADIPGIGTITSGWLGDVVYQVSDVMGARLITGPEKEDLLRDLDMKQQFAPLEQLHDLHVVDEETVNGHATWKLVGKTPTGRDETHWIDQSNYMTWRTQMQVMTEMGLLDTTSDFSDYRTLDGLTIPYTTTQTVGPGTVILKLTDVQLNPTLADARFTLPPEVAKLVKKQAATAPASQP